MSNTAVGDIYKDIIDRVIASCRVDFEESGVPRETLMEMDQNWKARLSSFHPAEFAWDPPKPAPNQSAQSGSVSPLLVKLEDGKNRALQTSTQASANPGGVQIKTEPGYEGYTSAQDRAKDILRQQYGQQASASISQMQQPPGLAMPGQSRPPQGLQMPGQSSAARAAQPPTLQAPSASESSLTNAQIDGSGDVAPSMADPNKLDDSSDQNRVAAETSIRTQIGLMAANTDSGLSLPISEQLAFSTARVKASRAQRSTRAGDAMHAPPRIPQVDGEDDDETKGDDELDDDAINSDLDDPDEELDPVEADDEEATHITEAILCTYDKVQRVKARWKCSLKDGVLTTKGRDYVFHKAQGEFEW